MPAHDVSGGILPVSGRSSRSTPRTCSWAVSPNRGSRLRDSAAASTGGTRRPCAARHTSLAGNSSPHHLRHRSSVRGDVDRGRRPAHHSAVNDESVTATEPRSRTRPQMCAMSRVRASLSLERVPRAGTLPQRRRRRAPRPARIEALRPRGCVTASGGGGGSAHMGVDHPYGSKPAPRSPRSPRHGLPPADVRPNIPRVRLRSGSWRPRRVGGDP